MRHADTQLTVADAVERVLRDVPVLEAEEVPLRGAHGLVLAADVVSPITLPPWNNSAMDGYAVHAADLASLPTTLPVLETVRAGGIATHPLPRGHAIRIMTGAPVPEGADSVVRIEDTDRGLERVEIVRDRDAGKNIRPRGEDIREGQVVMPAGTTIAAAQLGVLASVGAADVMVHRAPRVAILTSGDELVELEQFQQVLDGNRIVSSNSLTLQALVRAAGGEPHYLGIAADDPESLRAHLRRAVGFDLLITSAGVSVGEHDFVRQVLAELGAEVRFWRVRMRPGAPLVFGMLGPMPWLGLPGNPVSTMVTFELFARPAIRKMRGHARLFRRPVPVVVEEPVHAHAELTHFQRAVVTTRDGQRYARLTGPQSSGILTSMSLANALLIVPAGRGDVTAGETLHALPIDGDAELAEQFSL
ncbi:MAG: molybdopterin molybdotransferase MoeA [Gemmatimonadetes bacterium]|nr:molybdopterin molybdotransferase MoeA [Gemmatimonadota bacterium]